MRISAYLQSRHVWFQAVLHAPVPSASRRAHTVHVPGRHVAKAVLVKADGAFVLAVLPATARIDLERLSEALGGAAAAVAREDELESVFPDCELGALPPFGGAYGLPTVVDASLATISEIICAGNFRHEEVRIRYHDYEALETPLRARFAVTADAKENEQRRAG